MEYFRGVANPIGVKVGAGMSTEWLQDLIRVLNPNNEPGRLTLDSSLRREEHIAEHLPELIRAVNETGSHRVVGLRSDARQHREHR